MPFEIYIKDDIANQIGQIINELPKIVQVDTLDINNGLIKKGVYQIPTSSILLIKETP